MQSRTNQQNQQESIMLLDNMQLIWKQWRQQQNCQRKTVHDAHHLLSGDAVYTKFSIEWLDNISQFCSSLITEQKIDYNTMQAVFYFRQFPDTNSIILSRTLLSILMHVPSNCIQNRHLTASSTLQEVHRQWPKLQHHTLSLFAVKFWQQFPLRCNDGWVWLRKQCSHVSLQCTLPV